MAPLFRKKSLIASIITICLICMTGCSNTINTSTNKSDDSKIKSEVSNISNVNSDSKQNTQGDSSQNDLNKIQQQKDSQKIIAENIKKLAIQGKVINCEFPVKSICIEDVEKKWGKADKSELVQKAKGTYNTYLKHDVVFGYNKGSQIFEVRSFDRRLNKISLSMIKEFFGKPEYDVKLNGEEIIGYRAGEEFKILFVFSQPTKSNDNPLLKHYSVLYPNGTVNNMADDPGRKW